MNAPAGKFLVEDTWRGRVFGTEWRNAAGGSLDVLEPATGAKITSVGNATAADVRKAAAEARAAQPGWAATPYESARHPAQGSPRAGRQSGGIDPLDRVRNRRHPGQSRL